MDDYTTARTVGTLYLASGDGLFQRLDYSPINKERKTLTNFTITLLSKELTTFGEDIFKKNSRPAFSRSEHDKLYDFRSYSYTVPTSEFIKYKYTPLKKDAKPVRQKNPAIK